MHWNMNKYPLVMTASIDPGGMPGISVPDPADRAGQYLETLRFYLEKSSIREIVFAENSGYDLTDFQRAASEYPEKKVEFLSCRLNEYPRHLGKSYGELKILDYVSDHSRFVREAGGYAKVTGRFPVLNIEELLSESAKRQPLDFFCDNKDHRIYEWLHLGWNGHSCDTRFFLVTTDFYKKYFYGRAEELDDSQEKLIEGMFFQVAEEYSKTEKIVRRFWTEPEYSGKAGHLQISIIGVNDYSCRTAKMKRVIRRICRKMIPWFWF